MGKIEIQNYTTKEPITMIGYEAGICYGSDITNDKKNYKRGLMNLSSKHGRTFEFPDVYMTVDEYSARVIRELYTHIAGSPTRLQASTRYIKYGEFNFITPPSILNNSEAQRTYNTIMEVIRAGYAYLEELGIPKEDIANILPLGMETTMTYKVNMRTLMTMAEQRLCTRAYWEYRVLMKDIMEALSEYSEQWAFVVKHYFKCKCDIYGYCTEHACCGKKPKETEFFSMLEKAANCDKCDDDLK